MINSKAAQRALYAKRISFLQKIKTEQQERLNAMKGTLVATKKYTLA